MPFAVMGLTLLATHFITKAKPISIINGKCYNKRKLQNLSLIIQGSYQTIIYQYPRG